jgi:hypothetical protein
MNEWGYLEQKNEGQPDRGEHGDRILSSPKVPHDRKQVERTADRIRDELMLTLEELDRRRHQVVDLRYQAMRHRELLVGVAITAAVLTGITVGVALWRARHREQILARHRLKALKRAWAHPGRLASSAEERPLAVELGRKLVVIFATALATNIAKNSVQSLVPARSKSAKSR